MTIFWILVAGLAALALLFVIPPLLTRHEAERTPDQDQLNLALFRQQLHELDADLEAGNLDRGQYQAARRDLERELLHDVDGQGAGPAGPAQKAPLTALLLVLALPAFATWLYFAIGNSAIIPRLELAAANRVSAPPAGHGMASGAGADAASLEVLVERLAAKMEENPDQLEGWMMLGRTYVAMEQPAKGAAALQRALALAPQDPEVMISLAQALAATADGQLTGRPTELLATAIAVAPDHATGLWLHGLAAYQAKDYAQAVARWERLIQGLDPNGEDSAQLRQFIADAREEGGLPPGAADTPAAGPAAGPPVTGSTVATSPDSPANDAGGASQVASGPSPAPSSASTTSFGAASASPGASEATSTATTASSVTPPASPGTTTPVVRGALQVEVSLAEPLWREADVNHSLFIYAKAASGPPMPLAVKRLKVADLPVTVTLDDSLAMTPEMRLSNFPQVIVGARISASGQASPQRGDLEGETGPLAPADQPAVKVLIDRARP